MGRRSGDRGTLGIVAPLITLFIVLTLSLVVTRVATVALTLTGLSRESARFQARSAFTGAGFTTSESELIVRHPVRRRIVMLLMLLGNAGLVAAVGSLLLTFVGTGAVLPWWARLLLLGAGIVVLWVIAMSPLVDRLVSRLTVQAMRRWKRLDISDYAQLLHLGGEYTVVELPVREGDWLAERTLQELRLRREGMMTLAVQRGDGTFLGVPPMDTRLKPGDLLVVYGRSGSIAALERRRASPEGDAQRRRAERTEQMRRRLERETDPVREAEAGAAAHRPSDGRTGGTRTG
jgi:hypothetical protein